MYHQRASPPKVAGRCDRCGGELYQRPDDHDNAVGERLRVYHSQTEPLIAYYDRDGVVRRVPGTGSIESIFEAIRAAIET
jgi:adenylate kinase